MPEETENPNFKVVDRRSFGTDGGRREPEETPEAGPSAPQPDLSAGATTDAERSIADAAQTPVTFQTLVSYLATTAMFQLGLLPGPAGERIPRDLANARRTLDLLDILHQKTQNNLAKEEAKLLDDVLYELRLTYLEMQKGDSSKTK